MWLKIISMHIALGGYTNAGLLNLLSIPLLTL
jgi:hypothetical protein